jgi:4-hydroxybenzoate polyprenyltransferase and related prenyltransferases
VIVGLAQYVAAVFLIGRETLDDFNLFLLASSTVLIAAAGYIINDYYDVKIDLINKPERVVIGRSVKRRYAILFHTLLSFAGIGIGFYLSWRIGVIHFASAFLLWWYSNNLKRQPFIGNFVVALLTGLSIYLVNVLYSYSSLVTIYAVFAFFMTLVREIVKDMEDLKGDNTFGCKTLPILWGIRKTKVLIYFFIAVFSVVVVFLNAVYAQLPQYYFLLFLFFPLAILTARLIRSDTKSDFRYLSQFCKVIMILGIASMIFI